MLNIYLQHVLQTIIYFLKIQSQNIYFENTPATPCLPPPSGLLMVTLSYCEF